MRRVGVALRDPIQPRRPTLYNPCGRLYTTLGLDSIDPLATDPRGRQSYAFQMSATPNRANEAADTEIFSSRRLRGY